MRRMLSKYLSTLTLVPVVFLVLFIFADLFRAYHALEQANDTILDAKLVNYTSQLVHEMQKERGMSAGFLGSNGTAFARQITNQRLLVDARLKDLKDYFDSDDYHQNTNKTINQLYSRLNQREQIRSRVDNLDIQLGEALGYYTANNALILDLNGKLAAELEETTSSEKFLTLYNVAYAKEQAGIERAVLSNVFSRGQFTPALFTRFIALTTIQQTYIKSATTVADKDFSGALRAFIESAESREVRRFREIAKNSEGEFEVKAEDWFAASTARINKLKSTEQTLVDQIIVYAESKVSSRWFVMIFESFILVLALVVAYLVYTTIRLRAAQAAEINRVMHAVDDDKNLTEQAEIITQDELGRIAELINLTFMHVREDFNRFQLNATEISSASIQTAAAVEQSKNNLVQLQLDIAGIASATEEMTASIQSVLENMRLAASNADQAASESARGEVAVDTAVEGISETAKEVSVVGQTIQELNERVNDILGMVDVIKSVADQTNLLALNAAIEAARAGEQGRGFAVVADEVRSLAKRTQDSTEEISKVVDVLRDSSQNAFDSIENGNERAQKAVEQATEITSVLSKIVANIKAVDEVTQTISSSSKEQEMVITSVNTNVANIDQQARENVVGAEQVAAASMQLSGVAKDMQDRLAIYKVS